MYTKIATLICIFGLLTGVHAEPVRVLVTQFQNESGMAAAEEAGLRVSPEAISRKALPALMKRLLPESNLELIDRSEYLRQVDRMTLKDNGYRSVAKPTVMHAAQALNADALLEGSVLSLSASRRQVRVGEHQSDHNIITLRITLKARDAVNGTVLAITEGAAELDLRQTEALHTTLGEEDIYTLLGRALDEAVPDLATQIRNNYQQRAEQPKIRLSVRTTADPALVEIDGLLIGTTPIEGHLLYAGDHVLTVGKPGYRDITKKILFKEDVQIEVPMMRTELNAKELKEVLKDIRYNVFQGEPGIIITPLN